MLVQKLNSQLVATSDIFALIILYLSKCCVIAIYLRLTPQKPHNRASWATLALCTAWLIPAIFILLINCELNRPWRIRGGQCRNLVSHSSSILVLALSNLDPRKVNPMAIHRCLGRYHRNHSIHPCRRFTQRSIHVRQTQAYNRLRLLLPIPVSLLSSYCVADRIITYSLLD